MHFSASVQKWQMDTVICHGRGIKSGNTKAWTARESPPYSIDHDWTLPTRYKMHTTGAFQARHRDKLEIPQRRVMSLVGRDTKENTRRQRIGTENMKGSTGIPSMDSPNRLGLFLIRIIYHFRRSKHCPPNAVSVYTPPSTTPLSLNWHR